MSDPQKSDPISEARKLRGTQLQEFLDGLNVCVREQVVSALASAAEKELPDNLEAVHESSAPIDDIYSTRIEGTLTRDQKIRSLQSVSHGSMKEVGPYKILQEIGQGGMGLVFVAEQQRPVKRRVALKVIKSDSPSKEVLSRFEAERQALSMMDHQNIARVLDAGITDDGLPYFAMELIKGIPITDYCDQNKLNLDERLDLFVQGCRAIQHAHQKGIVHRDIKPSNMLVTLYDGKPVTKVIDFGLAKAIHGNLKLSDNTMYTEFGRTMGTFEYMSPEQAEMNALDIDTRTDVYSLGVVLYELLTGSTPLGRERLREAMKNAALDQLLRMIREEEAPRPSVRLSSNRNVIAGISEQRRTDVRQLSQSLKGDLDWIAIKSLEKNRSRRYDGPATLADDVERYLDGSPIEARPPSFTYSLSKSIRRNRVKYLIAATILGTVLLGTIATSIMWQRALVAERQSTQDAAAAIASAEKAEVARAEAVSLAESLQAQSIKTATTMEKLTSELLDSKNLTTSTAPLFVDAYTIAQQVYGSFDKKTITAQIRLAEHYIATNQKVEAAEILREAEALAENTPPPNSNLKLKLLEAWTRYHQRARDQQKARNAIEERIRIGQNTTNYLPLARAYFELGTCNFEEWDFLLAFENYDDAMQAIEAAANQRQVEPSGLFGFFSSQSNPSKNPHDPVVSLANEIAQKQIRLSNLLRRKTLEPLQELALVLGTMGYDLDDILGIIDEVYDFNFDDPPEYDDLPEDELHRIWTDYALITQSSLHIKNADEKLKQLQGMVGLSSKSLGYAIRLNTEALTTQGIIYYRVEDFEKAMEVLRGAEEALIQSELHQEFAIIEVPDDESLISEAWFDTYAFLAMTLHKLGNTEGAKEYRQKCEELMKNPICNENPDFVKIAKELEKVLSSKNPDR